MGRVPAQHSRAHPAGPGMQRHKEQTTNKKEKYKVILEEVTQKKKKLVILECSTTTPPRGYTFVAAGTPRLTLVCKELARKEGRQIYVVSTTKHRDTELSTQVHRVGYHFPEEIVIRACNRLGLDHDKQALQHLSWPKEDKSKGKVPTKVGPKKSKAAIDSNVQDKVDREARDAIKDLFPTMPEDDLKNIIRHAFDLTTKRVGALVDDLPLPRRVQLAVVAHIRHLYTDYDNLLKTMPYQAARATIEKQTLEKLSEWRGDDSSDHDPDAMEDILREVVVIPDDDDDEPSREANKHDTGLTFRGQMPSASSAFEGYRAVPYRGCSIDSDEAKEATALGGGQYILAQSRSDRAKAHLFNTWGEVRSQQRRKQAPLANINPTRQERPVIVHQRPDHEPAVVLLKQAPILEQSTSDHRRPIPPNEEYFESSSRRETRRTDALGHPKIVELVVSGHKLSPRHEKATDLWQLPQREYNHVSNSASRTDMTYTYEPVSQSGYAPVNKAHERTHSAPWLEARPSIPYGLSDGPDRSRPLIEAESPKELVLPSIEPATPTSTRPQNMTSPQQYEPSVIVIDSPLQNNKRKRWEGNAHLRQPKLDYADYGRYAVEAPAPTLELRPRELMARRPNSSNFPQRPSGYSSSAYPPERFVREASSLHQLDTHVSKLPTAVSVDSPQAANSSIHGDAYTSRAHYSPDRQFIPTSHQPSSLIYQTNQVHAPGRRMISDSFPTRPGGQGYDYRANSDLLREPHEQRVLYSRSEEFQSHFTTAFENQRPHQEHQAEVRLPQQVILLKNGYNESKEKYPSLPIYDGSPEPKHPREEKLAVDSREVQSKEQGSRYSHPRRFPELSSEARWPEIPHEHHTHSHTPNKISRPPHYGITRPVEGVEQNTRTRDPVYRQHPAVPNSADIFRDKTGRLWDRRTGREVVEVD